MIVIYAEYRKNTGTNNSKKIRTKHQCPAVIYGKNKPNIPIKFHQKSLSNLKKQNLYTDVIKLVIQDVVYLTKVYQIQHHHFKRQIIHIDFIYTYE